jgi:hypothetical protein
MGEKWPIKFSLTCRKAATWDRRLYLPSEERYAEDISARIEPANLGSRGQHANH